VIDTGVEKEACPFNMTPTSSTTAQLAMGDALAVALIHEKKFKKSDFMKSHPGGALGQRLACKVGEIMFTASAVPCVPLGSTMARAIEEMEKFRLGAVIVLDKGNQLMGIITDGDIRHCVAKGIPDFGRVQVEKIMTQAPHNLGIDSFLYDALNLMEKYEITVLPIVGKDNRLEGILHLHDILGKGSFKFNGGSQ
jgi:arabinose-5-phosphate isomerase